MIVMLVNHAKKPEKFSKLHLKRWQQNMLFYLATLNLARYLIKESLKMPKGEANV